MKKMRSTTKKPAFFTFCLYFSFLSFYQPLSSFLSLFSFRKANVSIHSIFHFCLSINLCHLFSFFFLFARPMFIFTPFFISVFLSAFVIFSLSFAFSPVQCFYSLQFYFCLSIRLCHLFSLFCLFARPMFLFTSILFMSFKNTNGTRRKTTRCKLYISLTISFRHFKYPESHVLLST
jgi:hypothetical protein